MLKAHADPWHLRSSNNERKTKTPKSWPKNQLINRLMETLDVVLLLYIGLFFFFSQYGRLNSASPWLAITYIVCFVVQQHHGILFSNKKKNYAVRGNID
jgi:hypothetical protein